MLRRIVPVVALLGLLAACDSSSSDGGSAPPTLAGGPNNTVQPGDGDDVSNGPSPPGPSIGVPADACRLLDTANVARVVGAATATGKASSQGPFRSCEYTVKTQDGTTGQLFLDVADQRMQQLYDVATQGVQTSDLSVATLKASYDPANGKVYVLTGKAFFSIQLPANFGSLTNADGLRAAATELATEAVALIGG
jgi:hypothetical protein